MVDVNIMYLFVFNIYNSGYKKPRLQLIIPETENMIPEEKGNWKTGSVFYFVLLNNSKTLIALVIPHSTSCEGYCFLPICSLY